MKKVITLLILGLLPFLCFAQLKNKVCIVRPNYTEKLINDIHNLGPRLTKLGVENSEEYIENFISHGSSGSGFVYVAPDGTNYIITNCHVIEDAATSSVVFQNENSDDEVTYKGLKILAANKDLDLAILSFPNDEKPFTEGLTFNTDKIKDGDSVYTAGFPGLLGLPSWQFGSGIITNNNVKSEELINPKLSYVIQHSAQIDAGNSGGPLLIKNSNNDFEVIGINTWKITNRQDTNFAIPAATISSFIENTLAGNMTTEENPKVEILTQAGELQKVLNKFNVTFEEITGFISIDYINYEGKAIFEDVYNRCNEDNRRTLKEIMANYSPIIAMRYAIAWYIFNEYHKDEYTSDVTQKSSVKDNKLPAIEGPFKYEDSEIWYTGLYLTYTNGYAKTEWTYINGSWKVSSLKKVNRNQLHNGQNKKMEQKNEKGKKIKNLREIPEGKSIQLGNCVIYAPNLMSVSYEAKLFSKNIYSWAHVLDIEVNLMNLLAVDITGVLNETKVAIYHYGDKPHFNDSFDLFAGAQAQLPIFSNNAVLMPYATVQIGAEYSIVDGNKVYVIERNEIGGRLNIFFSTTSNVSFFIDGNCDIEYNISKSKLDLAATIGAGFTF